MNTHFPLMLRLCALAVVSFWGMGNAVANPEAGGDYWFTNGAKTVASSDPKAPTELALVTVKCPVGGRLFVHADAQFVLQSAAAPGTDRKLSYCISKNRTSFDALNSHDIGGNGGGTVERQVGSMQRLETCSAGETVTYRFAAYRAYNLSNKTVARRIRLSVIHLRDRY